MHWPLVQTWFLPQAFPHEPQFWTVLTGLQALPHTICADGQAHRLLVQVWPVAVQSLVVAHPDSQTVFTQIDPVPQSEFCRHPARQVKLSQIWPAPQEPSSRQPLTQARVIVLQARAVLH
jgi:hypothetical protein